MTCPSLLRRRPAVADVADDAPRGPLAWLRDGALRLVDRLREDDGLAQFARFVLVGGTSTLVYAALYVSLEPLAGYLPAHLFSTVVSSILANEMHRRLTFRAEERVGWLTAQIEAGSVSFVGLVATSAALSWLNETAGSAPLALQIGLVALVTAVIGLLRFLALRWIFRPTVTTSA